MMSKSRPRPDDITKPPSKKRRIRQALYQQWVERELRDQLDALFAHRVYFATGSVRDARSAVGLTMAEFSDMPSPESVIDFSRPCTMAR